MSEGNNDVGAPLDGKAVDYEMSMSEGKTHVLIRVHMPMTRELASEVNQEAAKYGQTHGVNRFLYDVRGHVNTDTVTHNYDIVHKDVRDIPYTGKERFAVVHDAGDKSHDFIMTVARNAGYNLKLFASEQDAIAWLRK